MKTNGAILLPREYRTSGTPPDALEDTSRHGNDGVFKGAGEPAWTRLSSGLWILQPDTTMSLQTNLVSCLYTSGRKHNA